MFEAIPAAFVCILLVFLVLKWNRGELFPSNTPPDKRRDGGVAPPPNVRPGHGTFDAWASEAIRDFDAEFESAAKRGGCTKGVIRGLADMRSSVVGEYLAQIRFAPNDDSVTAGLTENMRKADAYMTARIRAAQSTNPSLIAIRGPMSCGDGDGMYT
jgi:hypothetical protein